MHWPFWGSLKNILKTESGSQDSATTEYGSVSVVEKMLCTFITCGGYAIKESIS